MKRTYLIFAVLLQFVALNAQPFLRESKPGILHGGDLPYTGVVTSRSQTPLKTSSVTAGEDQVWWNNHASDGWYIYGTGKAERYNVATYIPEGLVSGKGASISAVSIFPFAGNMSNVQVWISKKLPEFGSSADLETVNVSAADLSIETFNDVAFTKDYEVPSEGIYVGWSFEIPIITSDRSSQSPIVYSNTSSNRDQAFLYNTTSTPSWTKSSGNLLMRILFRSDNFMKDAAGVRDFGTGYVLLGGETTIPVTIENYGTNTITSVGYVIKTNDVETQSGTIDVRNCTFQQQSTIFIPFMADPIAQANNKTVTITEVNGNPNEYSNNSASGTLITILKKSAVLPVIEEFTATWCGYCPYGMVGMKKAHEIYGDKVALIAVHASDEMSIADYNPILNMVSGYPSAKANRVEDFYPNTYQIQYYINQAQEREVPGGIEATAEWVDDSKTAIAIDTKTTFEYNDQNAHYGIAYVLVEDGMQNSNWRQSNYLSGGSGDSEMQFWFDSPSYVSGIVYDHVAVGAWGILNGISGSVGGNVVAGLPMNYSYKADITSNSLALIQDKSRLSVITLLVDSQTGVIINAAKTTINDPSAAQQGDGDADGSGSVDVKDVAAMVNYIIGKEPTGFNKSAADLNGDNNVNIADVILLVNQLLSSK